VPLHLSETTTNWPLLSFEKSTLSTRTGAVPVLVKLKAFGTLRVPTAHDPESVAASGLSDACLLQLVAVTRPGAVDPVPRRRAVMRPPCSPVPPPTMRSPPGAETRAEANRGRPEKATLPPSPKAGSIRPSMSKRTSAIVWVLTGPMTITVPATTTLPSDPSTSPAARSVVLNT